MDEKKRLIKNTGLIAIGNLSTKLVSFFLLPLYTAVLSTSEYGVVDYVATISTFCVPFISLLMDESMFRFLIDCETEEEQTQVISNTICIILCGGLAFTVIAAPILIAIRYQYSAYLIAFILASVLVTMMSAFLRGIGRTDLYTVFNFLTSTCNILLNVLFIAVFRWGIAGMLLAFITAQSGVSVVFILRIRLWKYISFRRLDRSQAKEMIRYSIPLIPNKISWSIINLSDRIIVMNVIGSDATGLYAISHKFPTLMDTVYGFFYQSWKESSARALGDESQDEFYNWVYGYLKDFMYSIVLGMVAFMPLAFYFMIHPNFHTAILYVPILLLATYFSNISGFYGGIFTAYKDTKIMGTTTMVAASINLVVNLLLIWKLGLYAAALSTLIANVIVYVYRKAKVKRYILLRENRTKQAASVLMTALIFALFYSGKTAAYALACAVSVVYALIANKSLLLMIKRQVLRK